MISIDKVLPGVTPTEYCKSKGTKLSDYNLRGVSAQASLYDLEEVFPSKVPDDAEVVVAYSVHSANNSIPSLALGVALIPKK